MSTTTVISTEDTIVAPFRSDVAIGKVVANGDVIGSQFFIRYLNQTILQRIGGVSALSNTELQILAEQLSAINPPSEVTAQAAEQLALDAMTELAAMRSQLDAALQQISELSARLDEIPRVPDLTLRVSQIEDRLQ